MAEVAEVLAYSIILDMQITVSTLHWVDGECTLSTHTTYYVPRVSPSGVVSAPRGHIHLIWGAGHFTAAVRAVADVDGLYAPPECNTTYLTAIRKWTPATMKTAVETQQQQTVEYLVRMLLGGEPKDVPTIDATRRHALLHRATVLEKQGGQEHLMSEVRTQLAHLEQLTRRRANEAAAALAAAAKAVGAAIDITDTPEVQTATPGTGASGTQVHVIQGTGSPARVDSQTQQGSATPDGEGYGRGGPDGHEHGEQDSVDGARLPTWSQPETVSQALQPVGTFDASVTITATTQHDKQPVRVTRSKSGALKL
jgi:hypothetical protein